MHLYHLGARPHDALRRRHLAGEIRLRESNAIEHDPPHTDILPQVSEKGKPSRAEQALSLWFPGGDVQWGCKSKPETVHVLDTLDRQRYNGQEPLQVDRWSVHGPLLSMGKGELVRKARGEV